MQYDLLTQEFTEAVELHEPPGHATERWVRMILAIVRAERDPKTLDAWGRILGASRGTVRSWCYAARRSPKASLDFGRLLRAIVSAGERGWDLHELLDIVNERTAKALLTRAGFPELETRGNPPPLDEFLKRQRLVMGAAGAHVRRMLLS